MEYILLAVVVAFLLFVAWRERLVSQERSQLHAQHARERSELLTRITHPEAVLVPADGREQVPTPDLEPEQDDYGMVGEIVLGAE